MKKILWSAMLLVSMISTSAFAGNGVIPVREVRVISTSGACGIVREEDSVCPNTIVVPTTVTFVVSSGNDACHEYSASVAKKGKNSVLTIRENAVRRVCTVEEQRNFTAQAPVENAGAIQGSLTIANPTYVETVFRQ